MSADTITYRQQYSFCSKPNCRKCQAGIGHGPYWYAYQVVRGRTVRTYIGKTLPPGVQAAHVQAADSVVEQPAVSPSISTSSPTPASTPAFRLLMLGLVRLEKRGADERWHAVDEIGWRSSQTRALLGCLLSVPERQLTQQQACELLWPDQDAKSATRHVQRASIALKELLGSLYNRPPEHTTLMLADQTQLWSDGDAFEELLTRVYSLPTEQREARKTLLKEASALYRGDFFPEDPAANWPRQRRDILRAHWIAASLDLVDLYLDAQEDTPALDLLNHVLTSAPDNEAVVQRLMFLLARQQRRIEAVQIYRRLTTLLQNTTQATPLPATQALFSAIQRGETELARPLAAANHSTQISGSGEEAAMRPELVHRSSMKARKNEPQRQHARRDEKPFRGQHEQALMGRANQSPLVGREREMALLSHLLRQVEPGRVDWSDEQSALQRRASALRVAPDARCVVLMGDTGIGKTRLAEECARDAQKHGWNVIWNHAYSQDQGPYRLWTTALRSILLQAPDFSRQIIASSPIELYQPLRALMPDIQEFLISAPGQRGEETVVYDAPLPPQEELRLREAIYTFFTTLSLTAPLLLVLDDIQWADESSCQMLGYLTRRMSEYPMVILATYRENDATNKRVLNDLVAHMQREQVIEVLPIQPLTKAQIGSIVSHLVSYLPAPAITHIQNQVEGNPFFAEELAHSLQASAVMSGRDAHLLLDEVQALPKTVAAALNTRLDRLSRECKDLLSRAAVLGSSFDFKLIAQVGNSAIAGDEDAVIELLDEALISGVLTEEGRGTHITYHFWHPLLTSHLYSSLSAGRRASLHRRIADILRRLHQAHEEEEAATISDHLLKGGAEPVWVAKYAELAAHHAYNLFAYADAERHYRLALSQLESSLLEPLYPEQAERAPLPGATLEQRLHLAFLCERLAECCRVLGNFQDAPALYLRAIQLRALPERTFASEEEARQEAQIQAILWSDIAWIWRFTGEAASAYACNARGEEVLRQTGISDGPAWGSLRLQQASLYWHQGLHQEAVQAAHQALDFFTAGLAKASGDRPAPQTLPFEQQTRTMHTLRGDPVDLGRVHGFLGVIYNAIGQLSEGLAHLQQALAIHQKYDRRRDAAHVSSNIGHIYLLQGKYARAREIFLAQQEYVEQSGDILKSVILYNFGELAVIERRFDEAERYYRAGLALVEVAKDREYISTWNSMLGDLLRRQGRFQEAATTIRRALAIGRAVPRNLPCIGVALIALANLRCSLVEHERSEQSARGQRALRHAEADIERALNLRGLDAERCTQARLAQARVSHLLGKRSLARQQALQALTDAQTYELSVLAAHCQELLETLPER